MSVEARKVATQIRCGLPDCGRLLFTGIFTGSIQIVCKCGAMNTVNIERPQVGPVATQAIRMSSIPGQRKRK